MVESLVSVVMGVYNGAAELGASVQSVLEQQGVALELVVVNDGSTDGSAKLLDDWARRDSRVRVLHQPNRGLTRALALGCSAARGTYIARQDAGDLSLPGRFEAQVALLDREADAVMVSCWAEFVGPRGEELYRVTPDPGGADAGLRATRIEDLGGPPHHGTVVMRRSAYERVGGYRPAFYYGQDLDLWLRLAEIGPHRLVTRVLYRAGLTVGSISARSRREQVRSLELSLQCAGCRARGAPEEPVLARAARIRPTRGGLGRRLLKPIVEAEALYFVGRCLASRDSKRARDYYHEALRAFPLHWKSWARLLVRGGP